MFSVPYLYASSALFRSSSTKTFYLRKLSHTVRYSISRRCMMASSKASLAILDDYGGIARQHFAGIDGLKTDELPQTLNPASEDGLKTLVERLQPYDVVSTMRERTPFPSTLQNQLPNLKLLLTTGMRNASLDLQCASQRGVIVAGTKGAQPGHPDHTGQAGQPPPPGYDSTTQHTWALLLSLCGRIPQDDAALRGDHGAWQSGYSLGLAGKTFGVCGLGRLGARAARIAVLAFGMNVVAWSNSLNQEKADASAKDAGLPPGTFKAVSKQELFQTADVVSVHYVLSDRSRGLIGRDELALMRSSAVLVNTSRGPLIDESALLDALNRGAIRGAALDVWWLEPLPNDSPWRSYKGKSELVMSPHMGYVNESTMNVWYAEQADNVRRWLAGDEIVNKIN